MLLPRSRKEKVARRVVMWCMLEKKVFFTEVCECEVRWKERSPGHGKEGERRVSKVEDQTLTRMDERTKGGKERG